MSFKTNIPQPGDFLAISQKQLLANYQAIYSTFSKNHIALDSIEKNLGYHTSLTMPRQTLDPVTGATEVAFYNKDDANTVPQLFYRPNNNQTPIQMTNSNVTVTSSSTEFRQTMFLPGNFTLYMGYFRNATDGTVVTLTPSTTLLYVGLNTLKTGGNLAAATSISGNTFKITFFKAGLSPPPPLTTYYMAIGI